ncbi:MULTISPECIES: D-amino-acid transaminase [Sphingobium]|jgi:D-alanine transaminase|uniref:D-amino-acid transaminase n=1 Tax=Sphingobium TaxID=165695 RepID=UPI000C386090|nr:MULTISPECIES: D-amino-acid transaminase [Sphingobium]MBS47664.1 D-amino acid aminotransferase [Sphingobium sp.]MCC4255926.1 D-amino-acid transaminase [Sphingobium lactosutens]MEC9018445.1 D-amino-acid transaminase [Pseudomonadota bacterium]MEE2740697.1 D-amino-acid transaminase [Pseudomonadota bacterium]
MSVAYLNGAYLPLDEARISPLDRGFLFADGIYEVAAVIDGKLVDSASHLARLERSTGAIGIDLPLSLEEIEAVQKQLVIRNALTEGLVYLQVTRGADRTRDFIPPAGLKPTLFLFVQAKPFLDVPAAHDGIAVATAPDLRWARRDIKSVGLLAQAMAKQAARDAGAQEAWMVEDGFVTEGASSTAFILTEEGIVTRSYSQSVLAGCTGAAIATLAQENGLSLIRRSFTVAEAKQAKEAFITSASTLCQSVVRIDGETIGDGRPGPVAMRLRALYIAFARATGV